MKTSRPILYECIRLLMAQVLEEQHSRQALIRALIVEESTPAPIPTDAEVTARIQELQKIILDNKKEKR